jgi:hypothetical protein
MEMFMVARRSGACLDPTRRLQEDRMPKAKSPSQAEFQEPNGLELDPLIDALLEHLPAPGDYYPPEKRKKWLTLIELAFDIVYEDQPLAPEGMEAQPSEPGTERTG